MQAFRNKANTRLTKNCRGVLKVLLAAYFLVAIGLFSWLPGFLYHQDDSHKVTVQDLGYTVVWTIKHVDQGQASDSAVSMPGILDHVLDVPNDNFIKYLSKVVTLAEAVTVFAGFLLLWLFIAAIPFYTARLSAVIPVFSFALRNSTPILIRSVVLRH